jgi:peptidoglycan/xylan/chitin deacetylase (PgdA/CDA1 family)
MPAPLYIPAYDTESPRCLEACRRIVAVHRRHQMPATFFVVGKTLLANADEYRKLLDDPLFEIASHTWSHRMLLDQPFCGPATTPEGVREEIFRGKQAVEQVFGRPCIGIRSGCGFVDGLRGAKHVLSLVREAGFRYVSTLLWGRDYSLPAPLNQPFTYADDGFPDIWELPGHGWHENLLKNHNNWGPRRLTLWPPQMPEAIPPAFLKNAEEEAALNRVFLDKAIRDGALFVSLIWHPWSLLRFDPDMRMLELTFQMASELGLRPTTYEGLWREITRIGPSGH